MTYEERLHIRELRSKIQSAKEHRARRMWVTDIFGGRLRLGGSSRPESEQVRTGYPTAHLPNDDEFTFGKKNLAKKRAA